MGYGKLPTTAGEFTVGKEPELRFTPGGDPVCDVWVVTNNQKKVGDDWVDDKKMWIKLTFWKNDGAENVATSVRKGDKVTVICEIYQEEYQSPDKGTVRYTAGKPISFGPSTRFRAMEHGAQQGQGGQRPAQQSNQRQPQQGNQQGGYRQQPGGNQQPAEDPWGAPAQDNGQWAHGNGNDNDPPF